MAFYTWDAHSIAYRIDSVQVHIKSMGVYTRGCVCVCVMKSYMYKIPWCV